MKLPKYLCPIKKTNLTRLGKDNDGGYVVAKKSIEKSDALISFGISDDWSFEKNFREKKNVTIICFDSSVNLIFWLKRSIKDFIDLLLFRNNPFKVFLNFFTYFQYLIFFSHKNVIHEKKYIAPTQQITTKKKKDSITDLNEILEIYRLKNFFLKIDIEGSEYRILDQILKNEKDITGLVIEFHDCDYHYKKIENFVKNFTLELVHIHVNNYGLIDKFDRPTVLELTFSPKDFNNIRTEVEKEFPVLGLDQPNNKNKQDLPILFEDN